MSNKKKIYVNVVGLSLDTPTTSSNFVGKCPRCGKKLVYLHKHWVVYSFCFAITSFLFAILADILPYLEINSSGITSGMKVLDYFDVLANQNYTIISVIILLCMQVLPLFVLLCIILTDLACIFFIKNKIFLLLLRFYKVATHWAMVDVFLVGVLVSLVKLVSLVDVSFGGGFFCFIIFVIFYLLAIQKYNVGKIWNFFEPYPNLGFAVKSGMIGYKKGFYACHTCNALVDIKQSHTCPRCGSHVHEVTPYSNTKCLVLSISALFLYVVSNIYPMMITTYLANDTPSTILEGVIVLWDLGSYFVAFVIFFASVFIPIFKILVLFYLCYITKRVKRTKNKRKLSLLYAIVEFIGKWSMIDVFVVAIMATIVQIGNLMVIYPGSAVILFSAVVILTMLAANSYDCRLLWQQYKD